MKLSIVVPVYNLKDYVKQCLDSLCNQDVSKDDYEIIAVDDGSTDGSCEILDVYANEYPNIKVIHKPNGGVSSTRNAGLKCVTGEYIWFVDGDDRVAENSLGRVFEFLISEKPDMLYVGVKSFENDSEIINQQLDISQETDKYSGWFWTRFFRSEIILSNNITFDEEITMSEDDVFCTFANQFIKTTAKADIIVYYYRMRQGSALHSAYTKNNFSKRAKSFGKCLQLSKEYSFFDYKEDMIYKEIPGMLYFVFLQSKPSAKEYLNILKKEGIFPLPLRKKDIEIARNKNSFLGKIRTVSYSRLGFFLLKIYYKIKPPKHNN